MKHAAVMACVLAASVMPTAFAQTPESANSKAYEIRVTGDVVPVGLDQLAYPVRDAVRGRGGACDLNVRVDERGNIGAVMVEKCSSPTFRQEAGKLASNDAGAFAAADEHTVRIEWSID